MYSAISKTLPLYEDERGTLSIDIMAFGVTARRGVPAAGRNASAVTFVRRLLFAAGSVVVSCVTTLRRYDRSWLAAACVISLRLPPNLAAPGGRIAAVFLNGLGVHVALLPPALLFCLIFFGLVRAVANLAAKCSEAGERAIAVMVTYFIGAINVGCSVGYEVVL